jgi:hypothetical protein
LLRLSEGKTGEALTTPLISEYKDKRLISVLQTKSVKKIGGVALSPAQQKSLAAGELVKIENATAKAGQKQTVYARWDAEAGRPKLFRSASGSNKSHITRKSITAKRKG